MANIDLLHSMWQVNSTFRRLLSQEMDRRGYEGMKGNGRILYMLDTSGEMAQRDLAEKLGIRPQSLTGALGKLEEAGFIERRRGSRDKREQFVCITEAGKKQGRKIRKLREKTAQEMFSPLSEEEKSVLAAMLAKITAHYESLREKETT